MDPHYLIKLNKNKNSAIQSGKNSQKSDKNSFKKSTSPGYISYPNNHAKLLTIK